MSKDLETYHIEVNIRNEYGYIPKDEFGNPVPIFETSEYVTSQHIRRQNKATMSREWTLNTKLISWEVVEKLVYNKSASSLPYMSIQM